jgi:hypothetical protein
VPGCELEGKTTRAKPAPRPEPEKEKPMQNETVETPAPIVEPEAPAAAVEPAPPPPVAALAVVPAEQIEPNPEPTPMLDPTDPRWALQLQPRTARDVYAIAGRLAATRFFGNKSPADIAAIVLMGRERGVSAMLSLSAMHVIDGKVEMSATLIAALVLRSGKAKVFRCVETTDERAVYEAQRIDAGGAPLRVMFTAEDAKRRGLWGKGNWAKMPDVMLAHRACTKAARLVFPDVTVGIYAEGEITESRGAA